MTVTDAVEHIVFEMSSAYLKINYFEPYRNEPTITITTGIIN